MKYFFDERGTDGQISFVKFIDSGDVLVMAPWLVGGALVVTVLASYIALRRYTKV